MYTIHKLCRDENGIKKEQFVMYEYPNHRKFDLDLAIHMAGLEYCAIAGGMSAGYSETEFTYYDFVDQVPNDICEKYGFSKIIINDEAKPVDQDSLVAAKMEVRSYLREREKNETEWDMAARVFYEFEAKMREWSPELMEWGPKTMTIGALFWAREFVRRGIVNDEVHRNEFLRERLEGIEKVNSLFKRVAK